MKESELKALLDTIAHRKAVIKELAKATDVLVAKLESELGKKGTDRLETSGGAVAIFMPSSTVKIGDMKTLLETFDPRTMAALLANSSLNKGKQEFLQRAIPDRDYNAALSVKRDSRFTINMPRTKEQKAMVSKAIESDVRKQEENIQKSLREWQELQDMQPLPDNPLVEEAMTKPPKKKAAKKKPAKKKKAAKKKKKKGK